MTDVRGGGRLCNQIIRNLAVSIISEKFNLYTTYFENERIKSLGIKLFKGTRVFNNTVQLTDSNYFEVLNKENLKDNLNANGHFFQTKDITNLLYKHIQKEKENIIQENPFKERYNKNDDIFIHIRLTDAAYLNPGLKYYLKCLSLFNPKKIYIATDDKNHEIVKELLKISNCSLVDYDEIKTIQFGSTCKNIILSHGSFSAVIGYLSFYSTVYYPEYEQGRIWYGDMFSIPLWNMIPTQK